jgi:hypothetical protein
MEININENKENLKREIALSIKNISMNEVDKEMNELIKIGKNVNLLSSRSRLGNNIVDYFTFKERLETRGKYNVNFFEFLENIEEFKKKKFIQTMITFYKDVKNKNNTKNEYVVLKEIYNICISAINIMKPLNCMEIFTKYNAKKVLNFCSGWGGSTVAAGALNLEDFYGIEINNNLKSKYEYFWSPCKTKKGYSGTVIFTKIKPLNIRKQLYIISLINSLKYLNLISY